MDKVADSGSADAGSIPVRGASRRSLFAIRAPHNVGSRFVYKDSDMVR